MMSKALLFLLVSGSLDVKEDKIIGRDDALLDGGKQPTVASRSTAFPEEAAENAFLKELENHLTNEASCLGTISCHLLF